MESQTNSSITLKWDKPDGHNDTVHLTYWVQWPGEDGSNVTNSTTDTSVVVDSLAPAYTYEFSVWVEYDGIRSTTVNLKASTGKRQTLSYSFFLLKGRVQGVTGEPDGGGTHLQS